MAVAAGALGELRAVLRIVVPVFLQLGLNGFVKSTTLVFVGREPPSTETVAVVALGSMYGTITGLSVGMGITLVVGSYCAKNYGSGATSANGLIVRHCMSAHLFCFLFALLMAGVSPIVLRASRQPEELLEPVRRFLLVSALAWPGHWMFSCLSTVLSSQNFQDVPSIRRSVRVCLLVSVSLSCVVVASLGTAGERVTRLFTHDASILEAAAPAMTGVLLSVPPYSVMMCLLGALRSAGLQFWGAQALFVSYYVVGLPLGYCLGVVREAGLLGIWLGNVAALSCAASSSLAKVASVDWGAVVERSAAGEDAGSSKKSL